jgi:hypothetical protein
MCSPPSGFVVRWQLPFWRPLQQHAIVVAAVALWMPVTGFGIAKLLQYSTTPGVAAAPLLRLPDDAVTRSAPGRARLLVFAHPQCPCSRATIGELALILARCRDQVDASVFFYRPASEPASWARTDLWESAAAIPGVHLAVDPDGAAARRFGAFTSGQTLLYNSDGRLIFSGGITAARGHSGDNAGRDAIVALIRGGAAALNRTAVYGCSLHGEQR